MDRPDQGDLARQLGTRGGGSIGEGEERNDDGNAGDAAPPKNRRADRHGKSTQDNSKSGSTSNEDDDDSDGSGDPDKEKREEKGSGRRQNLSEHNKNTEGWLTDGMQRENGRSGTQRKTTKQVERAQNKTKDASENRKERGTLATRSSQRQKSNRESQAREKEKITEAGQRSREGEKPIPWEQQNKSQGAHRIEQEPRSKAKESALQPRLRNAKVTGL